MIEVANRISGSSVMPAGSKRMLTNASTKARKRHAVLQTVAHRNRERIHDSGKRRALLGDADEHFAGPAVVVLADGDETLAVGHPELEGPRPRGCAAASRGSAGARPARRSCDRRVRRVSGGSSFLLPSTAVGRPCSCRGRSRRPSPRASTTTCAGSRCLRRLPSSGMLTVLEIAPEMNGCTAPIMRT